jgi:DNA-directed RNA polymerase subunit RPC12/RpoP
MSRMYKCIDCGAKVNGFIQDRDIRLQDLLPCAICGSERFAPIMEQLPPEDKEINDV